MLSNQVNVRAVFDRVNVQPAEIAARVSRFISEMDARIPSPWEVPKGPRWEGSHEALTDLVQRVPSTAATGAPQPEDGYELTLISTVGNLALSTSYTVGGRFVGERLPAEFVEARVMTEKGEGSVDPSVAEALFQSVVIAWEPLMCDLSNLEIIRATKRQCGSSRGGWKIPTGYRVWVRDGSVAIDTVADGLEKLTFAGGTLLVAPFEADAADIVGALLTTFEMNEIDEIPHPRP